MWKCVGVLVGRGEKGRKRGEQTISLSGNWHVPNLAIAD